MKYGSFWKDRTRLTSLMSMDDVVQVNQVCFLIIIRCQFLVDTSDKKNRVSNHSAVVNRLADKHIFSCYHKKFNQEQGKEKDPTFFLQRNSTKPYHIDYCFVSADLFSRLQHVEIGTYDKWITKSDHVPVIVEFE